MSSNNSTYGHTRGPVPNNTVQTLAKQLSESLIQDKRNDGQPFVKLADNSPAWMTDVIRSVHGDKLPDDTTYSLIERCATAIADGDDPQESVDEIEADSYTNDLTAWLHARADHVYYLTQALEDFQPKDGFQLLAMAQQIQIAEVGSALIAELERIEREVSGDE
jgi:hypothetical protein